MNSNHDRVSASPNHPQENAAFMASEETDSTGASPNGGDEDALKKLAAENEELRREIAELKDKFLRSAAEMENVRRRAEKDRLDAQKFGVENLLKDLVPVLDGMENALGQFQGDAQVAATGDAATSTVASVVEGMKMVHKQMGTALARHGLEPVLSVGETFDPNAHQAIQRTEEEGIDAEIVRVEFAKGYRLNGRLLRPSIVSVAVPKG